MPDFRIAVVTTCFHPIAHADVIVSRWFVKREPDPRWGWGGPRSKIVSLYTHQCPDNDMSRPFCREHGVPIYDTVAETLCAGGSKLAVDGVILIGEHGKYDKTPLGATQYPRKELFDQIVQVFRDSGRSVPVFCDKHYSWNFDWAMEMVKTAKEMGFLLFGGSSIPLCPRQPPMELSSRDRPREAVAVFYGPREIYGYHSAEFVQSLIERRAGGESGVESVTAFPRDRFDEALHASRSTQRLFDAAVAAAPVCKPGEFRANCSGDVAPEAFVVRYRDGLSVLHANLSGHIEHWTLAMADEASSDVRFTAALHGGPDDHYAHFAALSRVIEDGLMTGRCATYDPQRNLLTTGITAAMMRAFAQPARALATPELAIAY